MLDDVKQAAKPRIIPLNVRIRMSRLRAGYSVQRFARVLKVAPSLVQRWEQGAQPKAAYLTRIAEVCGVTESMLLGLDDPTPVVVPLEAVRVFVPGMLKVARKNNDEWVDRITGM